MNPMKKAFAFLKALNIPTGQTGAMDKINPSHENTLARFENLQNPRRAESFTNQTNQPMVEDAGSWPTYTKEPVAPMVKPIMPQHEVPAQTPDVDTVNPAQLRYREQFEDLKNQVYQALGVETHPYLGLVPADGGLSVPEHIKVALTDKLSSLRSQFKNMYPTGEIHVNSDGTFSNRPEY